MTIGAGGGTINVNTAASNLTVAGTSIYTGTLTKVGPGTLTLSGNNATGAGGITVSAGTLAVNNTAGAGTGTGAVSLASGTTLMGTGRLGGGFTVNNGAILSPGNSIGTLNANAGSTTWASNGRYLLEYNHDGGLPFVAGTTNDLYNSLGTLNLTASAGAGNTFILDLKYLGTGIASQTTTTLTFATFGAIPVAPTTSFSFTGDFVGASPTVTVSGNNLVLNFTPVPEPFTMGLFATAVAVGGTIIRRRRVKVLAA